MKGLRSNALWLAAVVLVTAATLGVLFAPSADAESGPTGASTTTVSLAPLSFLPDRQIFNEDLKVAAGQVIPENIAVLRGDVEVEAGGRIEGNLSVIQGDVKIAGEVTGNLAVVGGDVSLKASAQIGGDVSVVGGKVERERGAYIGGNFVGGPRVDVDKLFRNLPDSIVAQVQGQQHRRSPFVAFLWRLVRAILWTFLITGLVFLIIWLLPERVEIISQTAAEETALSFATGAIAALGVGLVTVILGITICLAPLAFLLGGLLALLMLFGWAVTCFWLGRQLDGLLDTQAHVTWHPLISATLSALVITGITLFAWALTPCLGFFLAVLIGSTGTGAVLVHLTRARGGGAPEEPVPPPTGVDLGAEPIGMPEAESPVEETEEAAEPAEDGPSPEEADEAPTFPTGEELGLTPQEEAQLQRGAGMIPEPADFTRIKGVGATFARRLQEAGVTTFPQLSALTPEQIAAIIGWSPARVIRDRIREQAEALAEE